MSLIFFFYFCQKKKRDRKERKQTQIFITHFFFNFSKDYAIAVNNNSRHKKKTTNKKKKLIARRTILLLLQTYTHIYIYLRSCITIYLIFCFFSLFSPTFYRIPRRLNICTVIHPTTMLWKRLVLSALSVLNSVVVASSASGNSTSDSSTPIIKISGNAFFNSETNERFYIRGVDYQPGGSSNLTDPLADVDICKRDIPVFKDLGINTIRVYTVDNSLDHTECMQMLSDAGIYLILDINTPGASISRYNPACSYNADYLQSVFATIDAFADYDNVLGFFAGNEVINSENTTDTATYVKAVVRDMKKYLKARNYRQIPVGYSAADIVSNRLLVAEYLNCGDDADARIDMFGVNDYSWCGSSSYTVSGYSEKVKLYSGYSIPIFLSEFGCNKVPGSRPFTEIQAIYSDAMATVFSGGLVYEYSNETNNYGLVQISDDGTSVTKLTDYYNLKKEYASVSNPEGDGGYSTSYDISECPSYSKGIWEANTTLPDMPAAASAYFTDGAGEPLGTLITTQDMCDDVEDDDSDSSLSSITSTLSTTTTSSSSSSNSQVTSSSGNNTTSQTATSLVSKQVSSSSNVSSSKSKGAGNIISTPLLFQWIYKMWNIIL